MAHWTIFNWGGRTNGAWIICCLSHYIFCMNIGHNINILLAIFFCFELMLCFPLCFRCPVDVLLWCPQAICTPIILPLFSLSQRAIFVQFWWKILSAKLSRMFEDSCLIFELEGVLMWCFLRSLGHSFGLLSGYFLYSCTLQFSCHSYYVEKLLSGVTRSCCAVGVYPAMDIESCHPSECVYLGYWHMGNIVWGRDHRPVT